MNIFYYFTNCLCCSTIPWIPEMQQPILSILIPHST